MKNLTAMSRPRARNTGNWSQSPWGGYMFYPKIIQRDDLATRSDISMWWACPLNLQRFLYLNKIYLQDLIDQLNAAASTRSGQLHYLMVMGAADINIREQFERFSTLHPNLWIQTTYLREFWANRHLAGYSWDDITDAFVDIIGRIRESPVMRRQFADVYIHALHEYTIARTLPNTDDVRELTSSGHITPTLCAKLISHKYLHDYYHPDAFSSSPCDGLLPYIAAWEAESSGSTTKYQHQCKHQQRHQHQIQYLQYFPELSVHDAACIQVMHPSFNIWSGLDPLDEFYLCMKWGRPHCDVGALMTKIHLLNFDFLMMESSGNLARTHRLERVVGVNTMTAILWIAALIRNQQVSKPAVNIYTLNDLETPSGAIHVAPKAKKARIVPAMQLSSAPKAPMPASVLTPQVPLAVSASAPVSQAASVPLAVSASVPTTRPRYREFRSLTRITMTSAPTCRGTTIADKFKCEPGEYLSTSPSSVTQARYKFDSARIANLLSRLQELSGEN